MSLQILVGVLYFINKIYLCFEKSAGWWIGITASLTASWYFYDLKIYLLLGLECSFVFIQIMGLILTNKEKKQSNWFYLPIACILLFLFWYIKESTLLEFFVSCTFVLGIYLLALKRKTWGWIFMILGHISLCFLSYQKGQFIFSVLQFLSIWLGLYAIYRLQNLKTITSGSKVI